MPHGRIEIDDDERCRRIVEQMPVVDTEEPT
jgi:hypothetical protein